MTGQAQRLPIRLYQSADRLMIAAPMPGLEAADISVTILRDQVVIHGEERGRGQHERDLLIAEWSTGPYRREVSLPSPVDGPSTDATYGNGVLVVSLPKTADVGSSAHFHLRPVGATRGVRVGRRGTPGTDRSGHGGRSVAPTRT